MMMCSEKCPMGANCPNRGPPIFAAATVQGSLSVDGDPIDVDAIVASLAATLGVDTSLLVLSDETARRRDAFELSFTIFADPTDLEALQKAMERPDLMSAMASDLASKGVSAIGNPYPLLMRNVRI